MSCGASSFSADNDVVECLQCGFIRTLMVTQVGRLAPGDCPCCRYVGWAHPHDMSEDLRRAIRDRGPAQRPLRAVG